MTHPDATIGRKFEAFEFTIDRAKVEELLFALGREDGDSTVVPLTFLNSSIQTSITGLNPVEGMGISRARALHAGQEYRYLDLVYIGDRLTGQTVLVGIDEKTGKSGVLRFFDLETTFLRGGQPVVIVNTKVVVRDDPEAA